MKRTLRHPAVPISLLVLILLVGLPVIATWRIVRQERLNQALIAAIKSNDDRTVVSLLHQGANANCRDEPPRKVSLWQMVMQVVQGRRSPSSHAPTPLLIALEPLHPDDTVHRFTFPTENVPLVRALLDHGADVNLPADPTREYSYPLNWALEDQKDATVHLLLERGANTKGMDLAGLISNYVDDSVIADLLDHGADINLRDDRSETPLTSAIGEDRVDTVRLLLARHAAVTLRGRGGLTPLAHAMVYANNDDMAREIVHLLKAAGAKP